VDAADAKKLRAPFPPELIGKRPQPIRKDNPKGHCDECGGFHGLPAVHLDYVGHAATTDRFLQVDPDWTWEPMARGDHGEPLLFNGGLWINLTICGVTRPGFGDATGAGGMKEMIGDALRNAGMRFGVALDLWAKEDLHATAQEPASGSAGPAKRKPRPEAKKAAAGSAAGVERDNENSGLATEEQRQALYKLAEEIGVDGARFREILQYVTGQQLGIGITAAKYQDVVNAVKAEGVPFE